MIENNDKENKKLDKCKHCGSDKVFESDNDDGYYVVCNNCLIQTTTYLYKERHLARQDWNRTPVAQDSATQL